MTMTNEAIMIEKLTSIEVVLKEMLDIFEAWDRELVEEKKEEKGEEAA